MSCDKHKKYKAIMRPKAECFECWLMWLRDHPDFIVKGKDLMSIMNSIAIRITGK
jgi:hypothetical protein